MLLLFIAVVVVPGGVFLFILGAANSTPAYNPGTSANYCAGFATYQATYHGPAYATGHGTFGLAAPAFGLVLGLG